jgi:hypothetical protein
LVGESVPEGHVEVVSYLYGPCEGGGDSDCRLVSMVELDAGNGIGVLVLVDCVLAIRVGVPDLDLVVKGVSDDMAIESLSW